MHLFKNATNAYFITDFLTVLSVVVNYNKSNPYSGIT